ncbi:MAG TPA: diguanylate cyclase [Clostridia bacterium]|nr:diguanylate cyclase [Clostridia bacterium]
MKQDIYIIDEKDDLMDILIKLFKNEKEYCFKKLETSKLEIALRNIPGLIIINEDTVDENVVNIANLIKADEDNAITPVIVISSNIEKEHRVEVLKCFVEHYIKNPIDEQYLYYTIKNLLRLLYLNRKVSPLTGLPGNVQIQAEIKKRLLNNEHFAMIYIDLDNFKAYNDTYGFIRGDEIIKFTSKTILENVQDMDCEKGFVGHIGGDDFVAIVSDIDYEKLCQNIIIYFDTGVLKFFSQKDIKNGYMEIENRKGLIEKFPLTSVSLGVVEAKPGRFKNILEIGEVGAQVKHLSKTVPGSTYAVNKRNV